MLLSKRKATVILRATVEKLKRQSKEDFKGRHFEARRIIQALTWYLRYPLSYRDLESMFLNAASRPVTAH